MKKLKLVPHAKQRLHERFGIESTKFGVLTYKKLEFIKKMSNMYSWIMKLMNNIFWIKNYVRI